MFLRAPGQPPLDTGNSNRILAAMAGITILLVFMDHQAGKQLQNRIQALPADAMNGAEVIREKIPVTRQGVEQLGQQVEGHISTVRALAPAVSPAIQPIKQTAEKIFEEAERVPVKLTPGIKVRVTDGWDLYFIRYAGSKSEMVRVHRKWPAGTVPIASVLNYLQKGPTPTERGLLNPFDTTVVLTGLSFEDGVVEIQADKGLLRMSKHVIQDRIDQIVLTLTQFGEVRGVRITVPGAKNQSLDRLLKRPGRSVSDYP